MKIPAELREALDKTGLPWEIEVGGKHKKLRLSGKLVGIIPLGKQQCRDKRSLLNTLTQVRLAARKIKETL